MSRGPEQVLKMQCDRVLRSAMLARKLWFVKIGGHPMQRSGVPDFLLCVHGWFVALELKADAATTIPLRQLLEAQRIRQAGGVAVTVSTYAMFRRLLTLLYRLTPLPQPVTGYEIPTPMKPLRSTENRGVL